MAITAIVKYRIGKGEKARVYILSRHESPDSAIQAAADARVHGYSNVFVTNADESE